MTERLVCCQEDVRVEKHPLKKEREESSFPLLIQFLVFRICRVAVSVKQVCRIFFNNPDSKEHRVVTLLDKYITKSQ